jgi:hypothetical protein
MSRRAHSAWRDIVALCTLRSVPGSGFQVPGSRSGSFHRFASLVKDQVTKLRESGTSEVAFRVAVKDGKVNFTVRGLKGGGT